MSNEHNIDKLLKESFDNFSPEAPDVWQAVQQGVQAAQASTAAGSGVGTAAVQGVGLTVKIVAGIVIAAASVAGYFVYNTLVNKDAAKVVDPIVKEQPVSEPLAATEYTGKEDNVAVEPPAKKAVTPKQPASKVVSAQQNEKTKEEFMTQSSTASGPEITVPTDEAKNNEPNNNTPTIKETIITEVPQSVTKGNTTDTNKGAVSKSEAKVSTEKPYNPYAEDGEVYDKPTIPGSISPNGDGLNDKFVILIENETYYSMKILNIENGEMVFESKNKSQVWDGKHYKTGQPCAKGNYMYVLSYQYKGSEKVHEKSGIVRLF